MFCLFRQFRHFTFLKLLPNVETRVSPFRQREAPRFRLTTIEAPNNKSEQTEGLDLSKGISTEQDWSKSYFGLSVKPFSKEVIDILLAPVVPENIEIKPDGLIYLPEIKYRRILNKAFGPGEWGLALRGDDSITPKNISREYALVCCGRLVSVARGEQDYFDPSGLATTAEGAKSNALMRCCKDLGIASELWDPIFIRDFKKHYCEDVFVEHRKKGTSIDYPYKVLNN
ncbi:mitochondrial genome maintenance protein [Gigaspora rosea]|uniref:Mitochondrial genome maintenance protein MGM101 n=1 Tax=Gigaspora rosea TaxID=44941 RepID=A0A397U8W4_9GLOM|nr:mitochondrial genome maintenance protein [Gigaspora rosea]